VKVTVDGEPRDAAPGAHVVALLDEAARREAGAGRAVVVDGRGQRLGFEGALTDGGVYVVVHVGARPPSVDACLKEFAALANSALSPAFAKFLVRRAVAAGEAAGGAASARGTAALAAAAVAREDGNALWTYVAGPGKVAVVYAAGSPRVRDALPAVRTVVLATRDVLTFRTGATTLDYLDGVRTVEVGTTNKVRLTDYERRMDEADAVVSARAGDFAVRGFTAAPEPAELAALARAAGKPFVMILSNERMLDDAAAPASPPADVVIWSTPREARDADVVVTAAQASPRGDAALKEKTAAALWRLLRGES